MTLVVISDTAGRPPTLILKSICLLWYNRSMTVRKTDKFTATYIRHVSAGTKMLWQRTPSCTAHCNAVCSQTSRQDIPQVP